MAGIKPSFITGSNAKIKIGGKTLAYAQDISANVTVTTIPIETMGRFEVVANQPVAYFVDGTLSIVRYTSVAKLNNMPDAAPNGNSVFNMGNIANNFDPKNLIISETFDLEVFQVSGLNQTDIVPVSKMFDATFTRMGHGLNKRGINVDMYSFVAIMAGENGIAPSHSSPGVDLS